MDTILMPRAVLRLIDPAKLIGLCDPGKLGRLLSELDEDDLEELLKREDAVDQGKVVGVLTAAKKPLAGIDIAHALKAEWNDVAGVLQQMEKHGRAKRQGVMWQLLGMGAPKAARAEAAPATRKREKAVVDDGVLAQVRATFGTEARTEADVIRATKLRAAVVTKTVAALVRTGDLAVDGKKGRSVSYRLRAAVVEKPDGAAKPDLFEGAEA